ncbi:hypothetical protein GCM10027290_61790 [Micromonospora sonneratiae]
MLSVSCGTPTDIPAIDAVIEAMDRFYGETDFAPIEDRQAEITANVFSSNPGVHLLLVSRN